MVLQSFIKVHQFSLQAPFITVALQKGGVVCSPTILHRYALSCLSTRFTKGRGRRGTVGSLLPYNIYPFIICAGVQKFL